jgi:anaerobic selenocysteine-containing dehydrogenase
MTAIITDRKETTPFSNWLAESVDKLANEKVQGIALVALCADGQAMTAYWNMGMQDKANAESQIRYDCIDQMILANKDRYFRYDYEEDEIQ